MRSKFQFKFISYVKRKVKNDIEIYVHYTTNDRQEDFFSGFQRRGGKKSRPPKVERI